MESHPYMQDEREITHRLTTIIWILKIKTEQSAAKMT